MQGLHHHVQNHLGFLDLHGIGQVLVPDGLFVKNELVDVGEVLLEPLAALAGFRVLVPAEEDAGKEGRLEFPSFAFGINAYPPGVGHVLVELAGGRQVNVLLDISR